MSWSEKFDQFCSSLLIDSKEDGTIPLRLNGCQRFLVDEVMKGLEQDIRYFVVLKGRQLGITTVTIALDLFWGFQNAGLQGGIIFHDDGTKEKFRDTIARYYSSLPQRMKLPLKAHNRTLISFRNRTDFQYLVAGTRMGNEALGRARAFNFLHSTECAFYADQEGLSTLSSSLAEKNPKRMYVFESTANGFNHWYDMWHTAKRAVRQKAIFIGWWRKEDYCFGPDDQEYKVYWGAAPHPTKKEGEWIRKIKQYYDFDITPGQIAWHRWHLCEQKNENHVLMTQEYPPTEDEAFVVSGSQFFTSERITETYLKAKSERYRSYRYITGSEFQFTQVKPTNAPNAELKVWEEPHGEGLYVMGADPAYGSSEWADRFALVIFRCYADRLVQVAEYCTADISTLQFAWIIAHLGGAYRNVYLNLEITGPGGAVQNELVSLQRTAGNIPMGPGTLLDVMGCIRHYTWVRPDMLMSGGYSRATHFSSNQNTKKTMFNMFKDSFEVARMEIKSLELLQEMRQVTNQQGVIGAEGRAKDDRVVAAGLAHWIWAQNLRTQLVANKMSYDLVRRRELTQLPNSHNAVQGAVQGWLKRSRIA